MKRLFLILAAAAPLGGCMPGFAMKDYVSRAETIPVTALAAPATGSVVPVKAEPAEDPAAAEARAIAALLLPDGAGGLVRVREKHFSNGTRQEIIIGGGRAVHGENVIDVSIRTAAVSDRHANPLQIGPPSEGGIRNEILSRFPDVQMNIVTRPMRNSLGPFGLAIGKHANGARCVFAWQWLEDLREQSPGSSNVVKMNALVAGKQLGTSVRVRLCRNDATVDQLAGQIEGLRTGSGQALERIAKMDRRDADPVAVSVNGRGGNSIVRPVGQSLEAAIAKPVRREAAPAAQVAARKPAKPRRVARREAPPQQQQQWQPPAAQAPVYAPPPAAAAPVQAGYGQRFLAPVAGAVPPPAYGAPGAQAPAAGAGSLPPQAYRGPGG